jgi:hypothetical protein
LKIEPESREFAKSFEITRTIHSNSKKVRTIFEAECFHNLFLEVYEILCIRTIQIGKNNGDSETYRKS